MIYADRPSWRHQLGLVIWCGLLGLIAVGSILFGISDAIINGVGDSNQGGAAIGLGVLILFMFFFTKLVYNRFRWKFTIEDGKITTRMGILSRHAKSTRIQDLRTVDYKQGILQRILNIGHVKFYTAGTDGYDICFFGIRDPKGLVDAVQACMTTESND